MITTIVITIRNFLTKFSEFSHDDGNEKYCSETVASMSRQFRVDRFSNVGKSKSTKQRECVFDESRPYMTKSMNRKVEELSIVSRAARSLSLDYSRGMGYSHSYYMKVFYDDYDYYYYYCVIEIEFYWNLKNTI